MFPTFHDDKDIDAICNILFPKRGAKALVMIFELCPTGCRLVVPTVCRPSDGPAQRVFLLQLSARAQCRGYRAAAKRVQHADLQPSPSTPENVFVANSVRWSTTPWVTLDRRVLREGSPQLSVPSGPTH